GRESKSGIQKGSGADAEKGRRSTQAFRRRAERKRECLARRAACQPESLCPVAERLVRRGVPLWTEKEIAPRLGFIYIVWKSPLLAVRWWCHSSPKGSGLTSPFVLWRPPTGGRPLLRWSVLKPVRSKRVVGDHINEPLHEPAWNLPNHPLT